MLNPSHPFKRFCPFDLIASIFGVWLPSDCGVELAEVDTFEDRKCWTLRLRVAEVYEYMINSFFGPTVLFQYILLSKSGGISLRSTLRPTRRDVVDSFRIYRCTLWAGEPLCVFCLW